MINVWILSFSMLEGDILLICIQKCIDMKEIHTKIIFLMIVDQNIVISSVKLKNVSAFSPIHLWISIRSTISMVEIYVVLTFCKLLIKLFMDWTTYLSRSTIYILYASSSWLSSSKSLFTLCTSMQHNTIQIFHILQHTIKENFCDQDLLKC